MALITSVMLAAANQKNYVGSITPLYHSFDVTNLAAAVTNADRILIATLPANARVIGGSIRVVGNNATTAICYLAVIEPTSNVITLGPTTIAPSVATSAVINQPHSPITSVTDTRNLVIDVTTGSIANSTAGCKFIVTADLAFHP